MPNMKILSRERGKRIRKATGLSLPIAMRAGHLIERGRGGTYLPSFDLTEKFVQGIAFSCGADCCGWKGYALVGPKGEYSI